MITGTREWWWGGGGLRERPPPGDVWLGTAMPGGVAVAANSAAR